MSEALHIAVGCVLALAAWLIPRHIANTRTARSPTLLLDVFPVLLTASLVLTATGRPIFTGVVLISLGAGFALADRTKREALREPVVFSEMSELRHLFTHPHLYLPFAGPALVGGGAAVAIAICVVLLSFEPGLWEPDPLLVVSYGGLVVAGAWLMSREPALGATADVHRTVTLASLIEKEAAVPADRPLIAQSRQERKAILEDWQNSIGQALARHGGEIVPGSLSIAGQTIEAIVPIANLPSAEAELAQENVRVDLVTSRQVVD